jgi:hypothetical protein
MAARLASSLVSQTAPPGLLAASIVDRYLFENPWPLIGAIIFAAAIALAFLSRKGKSTPSPAGVVIALACCLGVWLVARNVTTDRERVRALTLQLVDVTARSDEAALAPMLADDFTLYLRVGNVSHDTSMDRAATLQQIHRTLGTIYKPKDWRVTTNEVATNDTQATSNLSVTVTTEMYPMPHRSSWRVDWRREPGGRWRVFAIELLDMPGIASP